ncbi:MAG: PAS domain-containing protein [Treponema sp.]|jgi:PAS domain S-box-containing protein|nr:PAS domain-containing protein [Treponema sp.]
MIANPDYPSFCDLNIEDDFKTFSPKTLTALFNTINLGVWRWHIPKDELFFDKQCFFITGYGGKDLLSRGLKKELVYFKDRDLMAKKIIGYLKGKTAFYEAEFRIVRKDGSLIWVQERGAVTERDKSGTPLYMTGLLREIARPCGEEKELRREKLFKENERLRTNMEILRNDFEETRCLGDALFNANPHIHLMFNSSLHLINCNPAAMEYFGFSSKETFLAQFMHFIRTIALGSAPADTPAFLMEKLHYTARYGYCAFEIKVLLQGETVPLQVSCKRISLSGKFIISVYFNDVSLLKNTSRKLIRQERQLHALYALTFLLFSSPQEDFSLTVYRSLKHLGQSVKADRVYIWKNILAEGRLRGAKISEWKVPHFFDPQDRNLISFSYDEYLPNWQEKISDKFNIHKLFQDLKAPLARLHGSGGALSLLIVPILLKGEFWGFIGIENCTSEHFFCRREEMLLKNGGALIASAIDQYEQYEAAYVPG